MIPMQLSYIADKLNGRLNGHDLTIDHVFIDSRIEKKELESKQSLFVALKGPNFDAHKFIKNAQLSGAYAAVVEDAQAVEIPQIIVPDARLALAKIAQLNRQKSRAKYVAVTGSSGKTTVKEMIARILSLSGKTLATKGNLNNDIGAPLTLLDIDQSIDYAVVELGANHVGEIAFTANLTRPDVALVNNVSAAHLQGFGDLQGVAIAKAEIYSSLSEDGIAIVNFDDAFSDFFCKQIRNKRINYTVQNKRKSEASEMKENSSTLQVSASEISLKEDQSSVFNLYAADAHVQVSLPLIGFHNIANALAAASCCLALDIPLSQIAKGLAKSHVVAGRLIVNELSNNCRVIDDSYNANLASMKVAVDLLRRYPEPRILAIGDMAELGENEEHFHQEIGIYAQQSGINKLFTCGELTRFAQLGFVKENANRVIANTALVSEQNTNHFSQQSDLIIKLKKEAKAGTTILVKGSRSAKMEKVVKALIEFSEAVPVSENIHASLKEAQ